MGTLEYVPDHFKTEKMCERAVKDEPETPEFVLDHFKIRKMYDKTVKDDLSSLQYVPDYSVHRNS